MNEHGPSYGKEMVDIESSGMVISPHAISDTGIIERSLVIMEQKRSRTDQTDDQCISSTAHQLEFEYGDSKNLAVAGIGTSQSRLSQ